MRTIINADDFGFSEKTNIAIVECFKNGIINSATLMANMPGTKQAIEFTKQYNLSIGIHFNLNDGTPMNKDILDIKELSDGKKFEFKINRHSFLLKKKIIDNIYKEFKFQIEFLLSHGVNITHIDSHHHIHTILPIFLITRKIAKEYKLTVRIPRTSGGNKFIKKSYKRFIHKIMKKDKISFSDYFINYDEYINDKKINNNTEIMVHPIISNNKVICSTTNIFLCEL
ncbi:ChbG/HpnK family deacetylase [Xenorhabdus bovienii]|uniref:ChbG/HpnK family deacetylase n=1 Tax=Xenorhabdus bovienii TaxID=40576 RepID=UPI00237C6A63|nr:ChbG/HpnK family deacetylase [Xenorhabdus bovienii]MDE1489879.1 ChbG/HpnK family deacetylase [Xenorhabdus bovienii]